MEENEALPLLYQYKLKAQNDPLFIDIKYQDGLLIVFAKLFDNDLDNSFHLYLEKSSDKYLLADRNELRMYLEEYYDQLNDNCLANYASRCGLQYDNYGLSIALTNENVLNVLKYFKDFIGLIRIEGR